jgi:glycosyltransferase involved in cell wall biosynthesis
MLSVLMPVFNAEAFLAAAIESILGQTHRDFRFIIVNDGSTDGSSAIIADYARRDSRIVPLVQPNGGITAALNFGLRSIDTTYVARMDADDISLPERFARQLLYLESHQSIVALGTRVRTIDREGRSRHLRDILVGPDKIAAALPYRNVINHPSVMMRTETLRDAGGYRARFRNSQDYDLWLRLSSAHQLDNLAEPLLLYRTYEGRASSRLNRTRQTTYSVAAAADHFAQRYGLSRSDAPIDTNEPEEIANTLATLLAERLTPADRMAINRHALRLIRYGARSAATDRLARQTTTALLKHKEFGTLLKLLMYRLQRQR